MRKLKKVTPAAVLFWSGCLLLSVFIAYLSMYPLYWLLTYSEATEETEYSERFTEKGFKSIKKGTSVSVVLDLLGEPFDRWTPHFPVRLSYPVTSLDFELDENGELAAIVAQPIGMDVSNLKSERDVFQALGAPPSGKDFIPKTETWSYSRSRRHGSYFQRHVIIDLCTDTVLETYKGFYFD